MFAYLPGVEGSDYSSHINGGMALSKEVLIDGTSAYRSWRLHQRVAAPWKPCRSSRRIHRALAQTRAARAAASSNMS